MSSGGLLLFGVNHKTAPVELREQLAIPESRLAEATRWLVQTPGVREAMILSTCNRVELLVCPKAGAPDLLGFFNDFFDVDHTLLKPHVYEYRQDEAVRHLFRVASSLDSMVLGEPQILGQVKEAYAVARSVGAVQSGLEKLLQNAFNVAKRVRNETQIGSSSVSIASIAVDLAEKIFGSLENKKVFLVGAGKMSELAARHLVQRGASSIYVANRTHDRAIRLAAQFGGQVIRFDDLYTTADRADIIITSTGSPQPIFRPEHGAQFIHRRRNRPMFFIDIAVPRDVDPEMNRVEGIFLYDIDDLQSVAATNQIDRVREAEQAESIIAFEVERYQRHLNTLDAVPVIRNLQQAAETMRQSELRKAESRLRSVSAEPLSDAQWAAVEAMTRGLMNKFLHPTLQAIKAAAAEGDTARLETFRSTFDVQRAAAYLPSHAVPPALADASVDSESSARPERSSDPEKES
ncbi:Glutamyl-tRNA reductase [Acidisarcina polymorpha]|uniref:Glutamyl-tRNA reductase n=1 Tax=Acidisarcina polymorpha TaxID=2211140 RepID=A0A2Z5G7T3_9BACT|nr:glutamyl-tRNA reductase [Acidisarcina polymorpha]AXC15048.1 Glutamyl-tRNA reductase [Acidisarcina polymorpha]